MAKHSKACRKPRLQAHASRFQHFSWLDRTLPTATTKGQTAHDTVDTAWWAEKDELHHKKKKKKNGSYTVHVTHARC